MAGKNMNEMRRQARLEIDRRAGGLRELFFVAAPGQEAEYHIKEAEARTFKADADAATKIEEELEAEYPLLSSDARAERVTRDEAADAIIAQADTWKRALAVINEMRRGKKIELDAATTVAGIDTLVRSMNKDELLALAPELEEAIG